MLDCAVVYARTKGQAHEMGRYGGKIQTTATLRQNKQNYRVEKQISDEHAARSTEACENTNEHYLSAITHSLHGMPILEILLGSRPLEAIGQINSRLMESLSSHLLVSTNILELKYLSKLTSSHVSRRRLLSVIPVIAYYFHGWWNAAHFFQFGFIVPCHLQEECR